MKRADLTAGQAYYLDGYSYGRKAVVLTTEVLLPGEFRRFSTDREPMPGTTVRTFTLPDGTTKDVAVRTPFPRESRTKVLIFQPDANPAQQIEFVNLRDLLGPYDEIAAKKQAEKEAADQARQNRLAAAQQVADERNAAQADLVALLGADALPGWARTPNATASLSASRSSDVYGASGTLTTIELLRLVQAAYDAGRASA